MLGGCARPYLLIKGLAGVEVTHSAGELACRAVEFFSNCNLLLHGTGLGITPCCGHGSRTTGSMVPIELVLGLHRIPDQWGVRA